MPRPILQMALRIGQRVKSLVRILRTSTCIIDLDPFSNNFIYTYHPENSGKNLEIFRNIFLHRTRNLVKYELIKIFLMV